uniref:Uncharacterized protein n=1 Tax=Amphilophus citrinellus TaxID=61819 RepID=A0A3Q0R543_AMPCI
MLWLAGCGPKCIKLEINVDLKCNMFAVYGFALLCWVSVSHAAPPACEKLLRPLEQLDFQHLEGRWAMVAGSVSDPAHLEKFKSRDSASITFANTSDSSEITFMRVFGFDDSCRYSNSNITLQGSSFTFEDFNITVTVLYTSCSDCAVMRFDKSKQIRRLYLFSRRRAVGQEEMEEFGAQAACLNVSEPILMDPSKELCPEKVSHDPAAQTTENTEGQNA